MNETVKTLKTPPLFRIWDPIRHGFGFTDQRPNDGSIVEAWTGRFDREGYPIYEHDIISVHHDWKLGWVRAIVEKPSDFSEFAGKATGPGGDFRVAAFQFAEGYVEGNLHQHPDRLFPAGSQFPDPEEFIQPRLWSNEIFRALPRDRWN